MLGHRSTCFVVAVLGWVVFPSLVLAQSTWYVDAGSTGPLRNGTTWCRAFLTFQEALTASVAGDRIRVAQGTYKPDTTGLANPRNATFRLKSGVSLEGGFAGCGAVNPDARDFVAFKSTLSGDLSGNDGPNFANYSDNVFHVVTYDDGTAIGVVLEGFTVSGGNSNGPTGLTNQGGGIHIRNGLIKCLQGGPTIRHCVVEKNWGSHHGAINDHGMTTVIEDCIIRDNHSDEEGGGLQVHSGSPTITNCMFINNTSAGEGGGAWVGSDSDPTCSGPSTAKFINCTFDGNNADVGGGIYATQDAKPTIAGCTFIRNTTGRDGAGLFTNSSDADVSYCLFIENDASGQGGGVYNADGDPTFTDCTFRKNRGVLYGGAMRNLNSNPALTDCVFAENASDYNGGAFHNRLSSPTFDRCAFFGNTAVGDGGAVFNIEDSSPTIRDSVFAGNVATNVGGAIANSDLSEPKIHNCTFHANQGLMGHGAIESQFFGSATLTNSIVWNHVGVAIGGAGVTTATYSDVQGGFAGVGNINAAPIFVDADGPDNIVGTEDDDLRLKRDSPGINVGDPTFVPDLGKQDLSHGPRLVECRVDMGAHESITLQEAGDFNADRIVNLADFAAFQLCAFTPLQHADWQQTCQCVFDFNGVGGVNLTDFAMLPWDLQRCDPGDDASCDDGDACNGNEKCIAHFCQPGTPMKCDDGNVCTDEACVGGACVPINNTVFCDDNNACTIDDHCSDGACGGAPLDCDDGNICTTDSCVPATGCQHQANTDPCNDGNACTLNDVCSDTVCVSGQTTPCDDGNPCTDDVCEPSSGCVVANDDNNSCDDGDACNGAEKCIAGACDPGAPLVCDDGKPCTDDSCDPGDGCVVANDNSNSCDDGDACNGAESCADGTCVPGAPLVCDDDKACTDDSCDSVQGCVFTADDTNSCDDGQFCTASDQCVAGHCVGGGDRCTIAPNLFCIEDIDACIECLALSDCEDNNACTDDTCTNGHCFQYGNNNDCEDGLFCTINDHCAGGTCVGGGDRCTTPPNLICNEKAGVCVECMADSDCNDGDFCNGEETCIAGACVAGDAPVCDDGKPCTDDSCDPSSGCVFTNDDTNSCDDGDACNGEEKCDAGNCVPGSPPECDDGKECTDDSCDSKSGCVYENDDSNSCDDGDSCTIDDACANGTCQGAPKDCTGAGDKCNTAQCDPAGAEGNCDILTPIPGCGE